MGCKEAKERLAKQKSGKYLVEMAFSSWGKKAMGVLGRAALRRALGLSSTRSMLLEASMSSRVRKASSSSRPSAAASLSIPCSSSEDCIGFLEYGGEQGEGHVEINNQQREREK